MLAKLHVRLIGSKSIRLTFIRNKESAAVVKSIKSINRLEEFVMIDKNILEICNNAILDRIDHIYQELKYNNHYSQLYKMYTNETSELIQELNDKQIKKLLHIEEISNEMRCISDDRIYKTLFIDCVQILKLLKVVE